MPRSVTEGASDDLEEPMMGVSRPPSPGEMTAEDASGRELPPRQRYAYGVGHMFNDLSAACWFSYLLVYLHSVARLSNETAGEPRARERRAPRRHRRRSIAAALTPSASPAPRRQHLFARARRGRAVHAHRRHRLGQHQIEVRPAQILAPDRLDRGLALIPVHPLGPVSRTPARPHPVSLLLSLPAERTCVHANLQLHDLRELEQQRHRSSCSCCYPRRAGSFP